MRNFYVVGNSEKTEAGYVAEIIQEIVKKIMAYAISVQVMSIGTVYLKISNV